MSATAAANEAAAVTAGPTPTVTESTTPLGECPDATPATDAVASPREFTPASVLAERGPFWVPTAVPPAPDELSAAVERAIHRHRDAYTDAVDLAVPDPFAAAVERAEQRHRDAFADAVDLTLDDPFTAAADARPGVKDVLAAEADAYLDRRVGPPTRASESTAPAPAALDGPDPFPWADDPTGPDKTRFVATVALAGDSPTAWVPLKPVLQDAFGASEPRHYGRATRAADPELGLLEKRKTAGYCEVSVTPEGLYLIRSIQSAARLPWTDTSADSSTARDKLPVDRFRATIGSTRVPGGGGLNDRQLAYALGLLADHRATLVDGAGPKRLATGAWATAQRYASTARVDDLITGCDAACDALTAEHDHGVALMLSLPRATADGPVHSYEVMANGWSRFRDRLGRERADRDRPGYVPDYVWFQEPQGDGWAHRHVVFGGDPGLDADALRADWAECIGVPACADVEPWVRLTRLTLADGWNAERRRERGPGLRAYYTKSLARLREVASLRPDELAERADRLAAGRGTDRDREYARLAFMWPDEAPFYGASASLREAAN